MADQEDDIGTQLSQKSWDWKDDETRDELLDCYFKEEKSQEEEPAIQNIYAKDNKLITLDKYVRNERIKFNARSLDELMRGGIDVGTITEFYGLAGSGKTQLCLQLALNCQLPRHLGGVDGKVIYVSSDKHFPARRLEKMAAALQKKVPNINFLDNIFIHEFNTMEGIEDFVRDTIVDTIIKRKENIKLIIIDSIAGIYRSYTNHRKRARSIRKYIQALIGMAKKFNFGIIATNHVTSRPSLDPEMPSVDEPALGVNWTHQISTRMLVTKLRFSLKLSIEGEEAVDVNLRCLRVEKSTRLPNSAAFFLVTPHGIKSVIMNK